MSAPAPLSVTTCEVCKESDDHPKQSVSVGTAEVFGETVYHPLDGNKDGWLEFHFDCSPPEYAQYLDPNHVDLAQSGVHGDDLRDAITTTKEA